MTRRRPPGGADPSPPGRLRCWQDAARNFHLASDAAGARLLLGEVARLLGLRRAKEVVVNTVPGPIPDRRNPLGQAGVRRVFARLRLALADDPAEVGEFAIRSVDGETGEIRMGPRFARQFLEACERMDAGGAECGDFALTPSRRERARLIGQARRIPEIWFWGEGNVHGANTF